MSEDLKIVLEELRELKSLVIGARAVDSEPGEKLKTVGKPKPGHFKNMIKNRQITSIKKQIKKNLGL